MKIIPLSEGCFTIDQTKEFLPFDQQKDDLQERSRGSLLVEIQPFVVITQEGVILLECGLGYKIADGLLLIYKYLSLQGIDYTSVTKVLLSHLHKDHAGGVSTFNKQLNKHLLNFPNAMYYVGHDELDYAINATSLSYQPEALSFLRNSDRVVFLEENGMISHSIRYEKTAGHSQHHIVFWITEKDDIAFFGADEAPQLRQMKTKYIAKYDFDGKKAMMLRTDWWVRGNVERWKYLFYHDISTPIYFHT